MHAFINVVQGAYREHAGRRVLLILSNVRNAWLGRLEVRYAKDLAPTCRIDEKSGLLEIMSICALMHCQHEGSS